MISIDTMIEHYLICALWSSIDDNDDPYENRYDPSNITKNSKEQVKADCERFLEMAGNLLNNWDSEQAGHDFWLSRNGHGAGFFDRTHLADKEICNKLQEKAKMFGEANVMIHNKSFFWIT